MEDREIAGEIGEIENSVNRKLSDRFVFDLIATDDPLYWYDTIQTTTGSKVTIKLIDGTKISLGESALVVLEKDSSGLSLKLKSGKILIEGQSKESSVRVNGIKMAKESLKSISLNFDKNSGEMTAVKTSDSGVSEQVDIQALKKAEAEEPLDTPIILAPKPNEAVDFSTITKLSSWNPVPRAVDYHYKIKAVLRNELKTVLEVTTKTTEVEADRDIEDGKYVLQVIAIDQYGKASQVAEVKFEVVHSKSLEAPELETTEVQ